MRSRLEPCGWVADRMERKVVDDKKVKELKIPIALRMKLKFFNRIFRGLCEIILNLTISSLQTFYCILLFTLSLYS